MRFGPPNPLQSSLLLTGCGPSNGASFVGALDAYTTGVLGAFSVARRLVSTSVPALIRVRRTSDNAELDIVALSNGALDTASITSFCGASDGFVSVIYNQTGAASNLTAAAANQGCIFKSGAIVTKNSVPTIEKGASIRGYVSSFTAQTPAAVSYAGVCAPNGAGDYHGQLGNPSASYAPNGGILLYTSSTTTMQPYVAFGVRGNSVAVSAGTLVSAGCVIGASNTTVYKNGTGTSPAAYSPTFNFAGFGFWTAGATISGIAATGTCWTEGILWTGERGSSVAALSTNQATYFGT